MVHIELTKEVVKRKTHLKADLRPWVSSINKFIVNGDVEYTLNGEKRTRYKVKGALLYVCDVQSFPWLFDKEYLTTGYYHVPIDMDFKTIEKILLKIYVWAKHITTKKLTEASIRRMIKEVKNGRC